MTDGGLDFTFECIGSVATMVRLIGRQEVKLLYFYYYLDLYINNTNLLGYKANHVGLKMPTCKINSGATAASVMQQAHVWVVPQVDKYGNTLTIMRLSYVV